MPSSTMKPAPADRLRRHRMPAAAPNTIITAPMPNSSASLSLVPKVLIAKSLSHAGVRSMKLLPTARYGEDCGSR